MILLDTSGLIVALVRDEIDHQAAKRVLDAERAPLILSPFVLAELDYLVLRRGGVRAEAALLRQVERGLYELASFANRDVAGRSRARNLWPLVHGIPGFRRHGRIFRAAWSSAWNS